MDDQNELDESDRRLAEALQKGIANGQYEVSIQTERTTDSGPVSGETTAAYGSRNSSAEEADEPDDEMNSPFMKALNAYRAAKRGGDAEAIRAAERHLQEVTRAELQANEGCDPVK